MAVDRWLISSNRFHLKIVPVILVLPAFHTSVQEGGHQVVEQNSTIYRRTVVVYGL
jgi:hypothetical protein